MAKYPLTHASASSFGPFADLDVPLAPGLNVVVGDNSTGKSQLLKLLYSSTKALRAAESLTKKDLSGDIASKLMGVFRPEQLGRLTRRQQGPASARVSVKYKGIGDPLAYSFSSRSKTDVRVESLPGTKLVDEPVFIPSHELLSYGSEFLALYDAYELNFEETVRDTVELLFRPARRGPRGTESNALLAQFADMLQGGSVTETRGKFFLNQPGVGNIEAPLLAEGHRKLAMITRLISNGVLLEGGYLFWDEPEANLNPASQRAVAQSLVLLAESGAQIFIATHSTFLIRELQMLTSENESVTPQYIGLSRATQEDTAVTAAPVHAETAASPDDLEFLAALSAEADQAERYLVW